MRPARYVAGYLELRVSGAEPERFLTELTRRGAAFWNASPPRENVMTVRVSAWDKKRARLAAAASGCEAQITAVHGLPRLWTIFKKRWFAAALLLAALLALAESQAYVWDITIEGSETVPDGVILQALSECGVGIGARWLDFSQDAIRNSVILRVPELRWMTVTMQGCRARVIVREKRTHEPIVNENDHAQIVAAKAGFVTQVIALHGTAEAEVNRAYLPGETLIGGYTTGRFGIQGPTWAAGTVRARTWYELTAEAPSSVEKKTYTGERDVRYALIFGKNRINFYKDSSICPPECDKIIERAELRRDGAFILPVAAERITLAEYETVTVPAEELREELEAMLMQTLAREIGEDGTVSSAAFTASEEDGVLRVTLRAECEEQIGVLVPLTEEQVEDIEARISRNLY